VRPFARRAAAARRVFFLLLLVSAGLLFLEHPGRPGGGGGYAHDETITYWFAPAVGYPVKLAQRLNTGVYATATNHEAVKVVLP
jgi:hypothetical protein